MMQNANAFRRMNSWPRLLLHRTNFIRIRRELFKMPSPRNASVQKLTTKTPSEALATMGINPIGMDSPRMHMLMHAANTRIDHACGLNVDTKSSFLRLSTIICTIGPVTREVAMLEKMITAGMGIARLNFSHGTLDYHQTSVVNIRQAVQNLNKNPDANITVAIAIDTKGPEIRTGYFEGGPGAEIELTAGDTIKLSVDKLYADKGSLQFIYVDYPQLIKTVKLGQKIFIDDGLICLTCSHVGSNFLTCTVENGGVLGGHKGVNLPNVVVNLPAVSEKDIEDLKFAAVNGVDIIFASFIRQAESIHEIRSHLGHDGKKILIIAKIEDNQGLQNIDEIIKEADGIMVARGDLGIEIPPEKVCVAQKTIISRCNRAGKPVIVATQMLESMIHNPRPTRAEGSDIANAVLDGADCLMLSSETAKGRYPLECIKIMAKFCREAEAVIWHQQQFNELSSSVDVPITAEHAVAISTVEASYKVMAAAIILITKSGASAFQISKYRPRCPIIAITRELRTARQCKLYRGIIPLHFKADILSDWLKDVDMRVQYGLKYAARCGFAQAGDPVVIVTGWKQGSGFTNTMRVIYVSPDRSNAPEVMATAPPPGDTPVPMTPRSPESNF